MGKFETRNSPDHATDQTNNKPVAADVPFHLEGDVESGEGRRMGPANHQQRTSTSKEEILTESGGFLLGNSRVPVLLPVAVECEVYLPFNVKQPP